MKRISLSALALVTVLNAFAYGDYGGYSSSRFELPGWFTFMGIIMIAWGILEIILFFKIWGMTNDIKALKQDHFCETQFENREQMARYLRKNLVLGNKDNVKRILLQNFIDNVEFGFSQLKAGGYVKDEKGTDTWVSFKEKNLKESIAPYVKNLMLQYAKMGEKVPEYIMRMENFGDYYNLFLKEDLTVDVEKGVEENKQM